MTDLNPEVHEAITTYLAKAGIALEELDEDQWMVLDQALRESRSLYRWVPNMIQVSHVVEDSTESLPPNLSGISLLLLLAQRVPEALEIRRGLRGTTRERFEDLLSKHMAWARLVLTYLPHQHLDWRLVEGDHITIDNYELLRLTVERRDGKMLRLEMSASSAIRLASKILRYVDQVMSKEELELSDAEKGTLRKAVDNLVADGRSDDGEH